jgi:hypothetical protein
MPDSDAAGDFLSNGFFTGLSKTIKDLDPQRFLLQRYIPLEDWTNEGESFVSRFSHTNGRFKKLESESAPTPKLTQSYDKLRSYRFDIGGHIDINVSEFQKIYAQGGDMHAVQHYTKLLMKKAEEGLAEEMIKCLRMDIEANNGQKLIWKRGDGATNWNLGDGRQIPVDAVAGEMGADVNQPGTVDPAARWKRGITVDKLIFLQMINSESSLRTPPLILMTASQWMSRVNDPRLANGDWTNELVRIETLPMGASPANNYSMVVYIVPDDLLPTERSIRVGRAWNQAGDLIPNTEAADVKLAIAINKEGLRFGRIGGWSLDVEGSLNKNPKNKRILMAGTFGFLRETNDAVATIETITAKVAPSTFTTVAA